MNREDITDKELMYLEMKRKKKRANKQKREVEFSKKMIFSVVFMTYFIIFFVLFMVWETKDLSPIPTLLTGIFGLSATAFGFYYYKAGKENVEKIKNSLGTDYDQNI